MKEYFKILVSIVCLIGAIFEVIFTEVTTVPIAISKRNPINSIKEIPLNTGDNTVYDFSADELGLIYLPNNDNFDQDYDYEPVAQANHTVRIPVLTYHQIAALPKAGIARDYFVSPEIFEQQLQYLRLKNYKTLTPQEFFAQLSKGENPIQKSIMLTFDDGNNNNYKNAFPLLVKYGFVGVFYISSGNLAINKTALQEMANAGMIIDSHGRNHLDLTKVTNSDTLWSEIVGSKQALQSITGHTIYSFTYAGCGYNGNVVGVVKSAGYLIAFSCGKSIDHKSSSRYALSRMHVYNDMEDFKKLLSGTWDYPASYSN